VRRSKGTHHSKNEGHRHPKRTERTTRKNAKTKTAQANTQKVIVLITKFYCSEHRKTPTHATADCFTIKNRDKSGSQGANHSFSNKHREISWNCYVDNSDPETCRYDMIIGRDFMHEIGMDNIFSKTEMV
jgi:hypothetical protein